MYLKMPNEVMSAARPSLMSTGMQEISPQEAVKGAATDASESDRDTPAFAIFNA